MVRNTSNGKKQGSIDNKTAVIKVEEPGGDVRVIEAQHYIRSDDGTVSIYLGARSAGIDIQAHVTRCVIDRVDTQAGDTDDEEEKRLVTDGGRELVSGDDVVHAGEQWRVARCDGSNVEIYQLGGASPIVSIGTVDPVPEVRA